MTAFNRHIALPRHGVNAAIYNGDIADLASVPVVEKDHETRLVNLSTIGLDGRLCAMASCDARYQSRSLYAMYARPELEDKIKRMLSVLPLYLGIAVYEAFRPVSLQQTYFIAKAVELGKEHPSWSDDQLYRETSKWVAPFLDGCIPPHCTGGAIDLVLFDVTTKTLVDMGKFGVLWGENPVAATLSEGLSDAQKRHRTLLMNAAVFAGLSNYGKEYWHVAYGDQMWGALNDCKAMFGPVKNRAYDPDINTICHDKPALMKRIRDTIQSGW